MKAWTIPPSAPAAIEAAAAALGLIPTRRTTLGTRPGSIHWHFKHPAARGTLEVTISTKASFIGVQSGRSSPEILTLAERLAETLARG